MDEKRFDVVFKTGRDHTVQCKECGVKSPPLRPGEALDAWCAAHVCGEEDKAGQAPTPVAEGRGPAPGSKLEKTAPTPPAIPDPAKDDQGTGDPDPEPTGDGDSGDGGEGNGEEEEELTREDLEKMTKAAIMEAYAPDWDGTKADLIDHLLSEEEEEEEENGED
jgi:hypothetical protein